MLVWKKTGTVYLEVGGIRKGVEVRKLVGRNKYSSSSLPFLHPSIPPYLVMFLGLPFQAPGHELAQTVPALPFFRHGMQGQPEGGREGGRERREGMRKMVRCVCVSV